MTAALRAAMTQAGITCNDLQFAVSDQKGEAFWAIDAANAFTRVASDGGTVPDPLTLADCVGEIGSAFGSLALAWLHQYLPHPDNPGQCGVIHMAEDTGARCAVVVEHIS